MLRASVASTATFPDANTTWVTAAGSLTPGSSRTSWNEPSVSASTGERLCLARSSDLGVNTISGLRTSRAICRRSRWKYWAAVVALATWMLSSAARVRKRSMRA